MESDTTYTPPTILDDMDAETIHARMLAVIPDNIDKTEGGFVWDFTMPAAVEKADAMTALNEVVQLFFPEWSSGDFLDALAAEVGLTRRAATAAEAVLTVTGTEGTVIPEGFAFSTSATLISVNIEFVTTEEVTIPAAGTVPVPVVCAQAGSAGNVPPNSIVLQVSPMAGIDSVTNAEASTGGTDVEDDETLRERVMAVDRSGDTSYVGCNADYVRWAQEVAGVGSVAVIPEWDGPGTVELIVMDANGAPATQTLLDHVYEHIISPDDPGARLANIGVTLTVSTATASNIAVAASVTLDADAEIANVTAEFTERLTELCQNAKSDGVLRYTQVGSALSQTGSVVDYSGLTVNGGTGNISISAEEYPVVHAVNLTAI